MRKHYTYRSQVRLQDDLNTLRTILEVSRYRQTPREKELADEEFRVRITYIPRTLCPNKNNRFGKSFLLGTRTRTT